MFRVTRDPSAGRLVQCLAKIMQTCSHNTDYVHINGRDRTITVILAKHCKKLPDDGSFVIRNMLELYNNSNCIYELYICASVG